MGVNHYEYGQKADVQFESIKSNLQPIKRTYAAGVTDVTHNYTVPNGKRWTFKAITLRRENTGLNEIRVKDQIAGEIVYLKSEDSVMLPFQPPIRLALPSGWAIEAVFNTGVSGWVVSELLIEEEKEKLKRIESACARSGIQKRYR